jgi:hypothetical protein
MGVPHHETEYGVSCVDDMAEEFSETVANAVFEGKQFTTVLKEALVQQATVASSFRDEYLDVLRGERESIRSARTELREIDNQVQAVFEPELCTQSFASLLEGWESLLRARQRFDELTVERQQEIQREIRFPSKATLSFLQQYLYRELDVAFPVLAATVACQQRVDDASSDVLNAIACFE